MKDNDKIIAELAANPKHLNELDPRKFEELIAEILASNGYDIQLTPPTRDGGYDIMAVQKDSLGIETTTLVECKRYGLDHKVGIALIRGLYGVKSFLGVSNALLVTTSEFSEDARKFVESKYDIQLVDYSQLLKWFQDYAPPPDKTPYAEKRVFHSCFISHSSKDKEFVEKLNRSLRVAGVRVWYAPEDLLPGQKLHDQIKKAINSFDKLLLVLSPNSMGSNWVTTEIRDARDREREENRQVLFPISIVPMENIRNWECFDADSGRDLAVELREYFIPDLFDWQNEDKYWPEFNRLLKGLRVDEV